MVLSRAGPLDPKTARRTPHADPWPRRSRNGVLGTSANRRAHPSRRSLASKCQEWSSGSIRKSQGAPLTQILVLEVLEMELWEHSQDTGRTPRADPWPRSSRNGVRGASANRRAHPPRRSFASDLQKWMSGRIRKSQAVSDAPSHSQALPGVPRRSQAPPGAPRRSHTLPGGPRHSQALPDVPRRPPGVPKR